VSKDGRKNAETGFVQKADAMRAVLRQIPERDARIAIGKTWMESRGRGVSGNATGCAEIVEKTRVSLTERGSITCQAAQRKRHTARLAFSR
jgi:hypothetical protein